MLDALRIDEEGLPAGISATEWTALVERLEAAGYDGDFTVLGAGMFGVVLMDSQGRAYKVARPGAEDSIATEFDFLVSMEKTAARPHLPTALEFDFDAHVLVREAVEGRPGGWGTRGLHDVYDTIAKAAKAALWTPPEYKENSFIVTESGRIVMVDLGMTSRLGERHVQHVEHLLTQGYMPTEQEARDWAWALRMDTPELLAPERAAALQRRLEVLVGKPLE